MKRKSPISVDRIQFFLYDRKQIDEFGFINQFPYDDRHDFLVGRCLAGIAVKAEISNNRYDKGARRNVSFSLVDMTKRCEAAKQQVRISLSKNAFKDCYIYFPAETSGLVAGHTYKLAVCDETAAQTLIESIIHLFDKSTMGNPEEWYEVSDGGVRPGWNDNLFKSLNTVDEHDYWVQFNVAPKMGSRLPAIMPELEIRLYYPDGKKTFFKEPYCVSRENYDDNRWTVECTFETIADINGVFYAELLCMKHPIAGFVFDTMSAYDVSGKWYGYEIQPMNEYSPENAMKLIDEYLPYRNESDTAIEADDLDKALDRFIASQQENETEKKRPS